MGAGRNVFGSTGLREGAEGATEQGKSGGGKCVRGATIRDEAGSGVGKVRNVFDWQGGVGQCGQLGLPVG